MKKNYKKPTLGIVNVLQEQMFCLSGFETIGTGGANRPAAVPRNPRLFGEYRKDKWVEEYDEYDEYEE